MTKIGVITYHSAYNYGSVLQAYATQEAIKKLSFQDVSIINYRTKEQKRVYALYRTMHGPIIFLEDCCLLLVHKLRSKRVVRFESFIKTYMNLTEESSSVEDCFRIMNRYDIMVSGSDQIWNKYSLELANVPWPEMQPYLLSGFNKKRVSYASSIGNMSDEEILRLKEDLKNYYSISFRENSSAQRFTQITKIPASVVLDPTFLLCKEEWIEMLNLQNDTERYVLFYGLGGLGYLNNVLSHLKPLCMKLNYKLRIVMPYAYLPFQGCNVEFCSDAGPKELLGLIMNSSIVITNSYHGTILSVNFGKDVYSICDGGGTDFRKTEVLTKLGLADRIVSSIDCISDCFCNHIDYSPVFEKLEVLRKESMDYLQKGLNG